MRDAGGAAPERASVLCGVIARSGGSGVDPPCAQFKLTQLRLARPDICRCHSRVGERVEAIAPARRAPARLAVTCLASSRTRAHRCSRSRHGPATLLPLPHHINLPAILATPNPRTRPPPRCDSRLAGAQYLEGHDTLIQTGARLGETSAALALPLATRHLAPARVYTPLLLVLLHLQRCLTGCTSCAHLAKSPRPRLRQRT